MACRSRTLPRQCLSCQHPHLTATPASPASLPDWQTPRCSLSPLLVGPHSFQSDLLHIWSLAPLPLISLWTPPPKSGCSLSLGTCPALCDLWALVPPMPSTQHTLPGRHPAHPPGPSTKRLPPRSLQGSALCLLAPTQPALISVSPHPSAKHRMGASGTPAGKDGCRRLEQPLNALSLFGDPQSRRETSPNHQQDIQTAGPKGGLSCHPWASAQGQPRAHQGPAWCPSCHITAACATRRQGREEGPAPGAVWRGQGRVVGEGKRRPRELEAISCVHTSPPTSGSHSGPKASSSYGAKGAPGRSERGSPPPLPTSGGGAKAGAARVSGGTAHLLPNLHGSSFFDRLQVHVFFAAELCRKFQAPPSPSPHPERKFGSPHPGLAGRRQRPARAD